MVVPSIGHIETAADYLKHGPETQQEQRLRDTQDHEIRSFGDVAAQRIGASGLSDDFLIGFTLGVETMRVFVNQMPGSKLEL